MKPTIPVAMQGGILQAKKPSGWFFSSSLSRHLAAALVPEHSETMINSFQTTPGHQGQAVLFFKARSALTCPHQSEYKLFVATFFIP